MTTLPRRAGLIAAATLLSLAWYLPIEAQPPAGTTGSAAGQTDTTDDDDDDGDLARKVEIMNSPRWRRAIFELGEWLSAQVVYTPTQVRNIKADFNQKVEKMTSQELEYLLDDLDSKFKILDTPEARDARSWLGQYLSAMSDQKRAETLRNVPNIMTMNATQLQQEIQRIEQKRDTLQQRQAAFDQGRQQLVEQAQAARQQTAAASQAAMRQRGGPSYSPYRSGGGGGKPPFSDVRGSGMVITSGPFGAYVGINVGGF